jgi:hypothetical protein
MKDDPIASILRGRDGEDENSRPAEPQQSQGAARVPRTPNQRKAQVMGQVEDFFKKNKFMPLVGLAVIIGGSVGVLAFVSSNINGAKTASAQAAGRDDTDWKTAALNAQESERLAKGESQRILQSWIQSDPALKAVKGQIILPKVPPKSTLPKPAPYKARIAVSTKKLPAIPRTQIVYRYRPAPSFIAPAPRPIAPSRLLATSARIETGKSVVENPDYKLAESVVIAQAPSAPGPKEATVQTNTNGLPAGTIFEAKLVGRLGYEGTQANSAIPIKVEVTKDFSTRGRVIMPAGTVLLGQLAKTSKSGYVELNFLRGHFPDAPKSFNLKAIATSPDGGPLIVPAPRKADGTLADVFAVGLSAGSGAFSAGLQQTQQYNNGFGGYGTNSIATNNNDPSREALRQAFGTALGIVQKNAADARADAKAGNLDFSLPADTILQVFLVDDVEFPPVQ